MELIVERLDGTQYNTSDYGLKVLNFRMDSPEAITAKEEILNRDGYIDMGTSYAGRKGYGSFLMQASDSLDFPLLRNEIFVLFNSKEPFYIIDSREPGKRWLLKVDGKFTPEQLVGNIGQFDVDFISPSAYAESIGTTLDPKTFGVGLWQVGQGLIADETMYTHTTNSFSIYNAGDVEINPRFIPLAIIYQGASENLKIRNETNGTEWQYTGATVSTDTITLDGIRSLKNGVSIFGDTNRKLITLEKGRNDFTLTGASGSFSISFDFRFYTL